MNEENLPEHSVTLGALAKSLAAAQSKLEDAKKDATNPAFKSRFATLASVRAAMSDVLPACGLAVVQSFEPSGEAGVCVVTTLLHESGEWIRSRLYLPVTKKDAQGFGSAITYARRYSLAAIVGIATMDDDDGNEAVKHAPAVKAASPTSELVSVDKYVDAVEASKEVRDLMAVYKKVAEDKQLTDAQKTYVTSLCSTRRRAIEKAAAA